MQWSPVILKQLAVIIVLNIPTKHLTLLKTLTFAPDVIKHSTTKQ